MTLVTSRSSITPAALLLTGLTLASGCSTTWDTPLVVAPHDVQYADGSCGIYEDSLQVEEMILQPVDPYDGSFELSYVLSGVAYDLTDCTRGSDAGDTLYCDRVAMDGIVEPPLGLVVALSGWVKAKVVEYSLVHGLFCNSDNDADCAGRIPGDDGVCEMSLLGIAAYAE